MSIIEIILPESAAGERRSTHGAERRTLIRHDVSEPITLHSRRGCLTGQLADLSSTGARIYIVRGSVPAIGDAATIELLDQRYLCGEIAWVGDTEVGVAFARALPSVEEFVWSEARNPDWFRSVARKVRAREF